MLIRGNRAIVILCISVATIVSLVALNAAPAEQAFKETKTMLSTYITLTVMDTDEAAAKAHIAAGFARITELDKILSAHDKNSELSKLNAAAGKGPVKVSDELWRAVNIGIDWGKKTNGAFDITISPLLEVWKAAAKGNRLPTGEEIAAAKARMGLERIKVDKEARTVELPDGMVLDIGGVGKGFCADEVKKVFESRGVKRALISMAGDICAMSNHAENQPWRIGVQDPRSPEDQNAIVETLLLTSCSVSTSGNYQRYVVISGRHYSHIVDPKTGMTADAVPSVTVIGPDTVTTDILDTALSVIGVEKGLELVKSLPGVEAMFITYNEDEEPIYTRSPGFSKYEEKPAENPD